MLPMPSERESGIIKTRFIYKNGFWLIYNQVMIVDMPAEWILKNIFSSSFF